MRTFIFLAIAFAGFIAVMVAHRLSTENVVEPDTGSGHLDAQALALCLSSSGSQLFGAVWCPACRHQEELFGGAASYLDHVDCDDSPSLCAEAGVRAIPAWQIAGRLHTGVQSLDKLADLSGCREEATVREFTQEMADLPEMGDWQVSEISYSWRDPQGGFHVTTDAPPKGATDVEVFR